jgi:hypothetical protein
MGHPPVAEVTQESTRYSECIQSRMIKEALVFYRKYRVDEGGRNIGIGKGISVTCF